MSTDGGSKATGRDAKGRILPGHHLNGGGRERLPEAFKARGQEALSKVLAIMEDSKDEKLQLKAAQWVAERIYGRAPVSVELGEGGSMNEALAALLLSRKPEDK